MSEMATGRDAGFLARPRQLDSDSGLAKGTRIMTLDGELPVEYLEVGDFIVTRSGSHELRHLSSRKIKVFRPVLVCESALGHNRPERDLVLAPGQMVHLRDWRARALFGSDQAAAPVSRLIDGQYIRQTDASVQLRVFELEFDEPQVFYAEGVEVMSVTPPARHRRAFAAC